MNENQRKHLEFLQNIIDRMSQNSFKLKEWMLTLVSALLALYASSSNRLYIEIALGATIVFWLLDAYYLQQERKFRGIYNDVAEVSDEESRIQVKEFEMPIHKYIGCKYCYFNVLKSKTIALLYIPMIILLVVLLLWKGC